MRRMFIGLAVLVLAAGSARAQNPFVGNDLKLDKTDLALMDEIATALLHGSESQPGTSVSWHNAVTNRSGVITVLDSSQKDGRPCHKLQYTVPIATPARTRNYILRWCQQPDNDWKIVS